MRSSSNAIERGAESHRNVFPPNTTNAQAGPPALCLRFDSICLRAVRRSYPRRRKPTANNPIISSTIALGSGTAPPPPPSPPPLPAPARNAEVGPPSVVIPGRTRLARTRSPAASTCPSQLKSPGAQAPSSIQRDVAAGVIDRISRGNGIEHAGVSSGVGTDDPARAGAGAGHHQEISRQQIDVAGDSELIGRGAAELNRPTRTRQLSVTAAAHVQRSHALAGGNDAAVRTAPPTGARAAKSSRAA